MTESDAPRTDRGTLGGIALCAIPVATFSSVTLYTTAHDAGVPVWLAWVLPVATDVSAFVATRIWLSARYSQGIRRYAATIAIAAMTLSFLGASLHYAVEASPWWLRMAVGGLPTLSLAAIMHLAAMISADRTDKRMPPSAKRPTSERAAAPRSPRRRAVQENVSASEVPTVTPTAAPDTSDALAPDVIEAGAQDGEVPAPRTEAGTARADRSNVVALNEGRATRDQMLAYLGDHPDATGAELDRVFGTKNYGARIRRAWLSQQDQREKVSGE